MAAGSQKRQNKSLKGGSNGGPTRNRKLNGQEEREREARQADAFVHKEVVSKMSEPAYPERTRHQWTPVQLAAARLYGQGFSRTEIAHALVDHIIPPGRDKKGYMRTREKRLKSSRSTLKRWEEEQWFRDKIFDLAVIKTDLEIPMVMQGVVKKAKRGRVDAAKLVLQMAGRMTTEEQAGGNVTVVFGAIPRPEGRGAIEEVVVEDAEYEELE